MGRRSNRMVVCAVVAVVLFGLLTVPVGTVAAGDLTCEYPIERTDATGTAVGINDEPETIVTLAPSAAQTLWEIEAEDKVIGMTMHAAFFDGADERANVSADPMSIDIEKVVDLDPDLVLAPNVTPHEEIEELRDLGLTVYHFEASESVDDIVEKTKLQTELVGACDTGGDRIADMEASLERIDEIVDTLDVRQSIYFTMGDGITAGAGTFQSDALERAGLSNIAVEAGVEGWGMLSEEMVIEHDPDWIVYTDSFPEAPISEGERETTAWQADQVIVVDAQDFSQPAPRIVNAIESIHEAVYDEAAPETPTPTPTDPTTPTPTPTEVAPTPTPEDADPIPGFGVVVAILALAGAGWLIARA